MNFLLQLISLLVVATQEKCKPTSDPSEFYKRPHFIHSPDPVFAVQNEKTVIKVWSEIYNCITAILSFLILVIYTDLSNHIS